MEKLTLYPKTSRIKKTKPPVVVTEKLDGSNLALFKKDGELFIATRNNVFALSELEAAKGTVYKGSYQWLKDHGAEIRDNLNEGSVICGEWIGMGHIKYPHLHNRFYMFAKANIDEEKPDLCLKNIKYDQTLFIYPFVDMTIPDYISLVPIVTVLEDYPSVKELDILYKDYTNEQNRKVEGFIVNFGNNIEKYVRLKCGKLQEHHE